MTLPPSRVREIALRNVSAGYVGDFKILKTVSLNFRPDHRTLLVGPNGGGKSTLLKAIVGLAKVLAGNVAVNDRDTTNDSVRALYLLGVAYVPADNRTFNSLTVSENLDVVLATVGRAERARRLERIYTLFPALSVKRRALAEALSGGEQQILNIARAVLGGASALLLDEPTSGLSPSVAEALAEEIDRLGSSEGLLFAIAEHNLLWGAKVCTTFYALRDGEIVDQGQARDLIHNTDRVRTIFL